MSRGELRIGTSGWNYKHWKGIFYPSGMKPESEFEYYQQYFDTVEINNSFYHLPSADVFEHWKASTGKGFLFTVKCNRYITHMKKLKDCAESWSAFYTNASSLGRKLGPVLLQFPPRWKCNTARLADFCQLQHTRNKLVLEFRNTSWLSEEVYTVMRKHGLTFCIYDLGGYQSPSIVTADAVYIRLHGPGEKYRGSYSPKVLKEWAGRIMDWQAAGKDAYVYFDNDESAYAVKNAITLKELLA